MLGVGWYGCNDESGLQLDYEAMPYGQLSDYGFYIGEMSELNPADGLIEYSLNSSLFTDYAHKKRFIYHPKGASAVVDESGVIHYSEGTIIVKNFYYPMDFRAPDRDWDIIETRLLVRMDDQWDTYSYIWDERDSDASLSHVGGYADVSWLDEQGESRQVQYQIPNTNQCKGCHIVGDEIMPIGPKLANLDKTIQTATGEINQIALWKEKGIISDSHPTIVSMVDWSDASADLADRAMAYLDINCGHCHSPQGPAHTSGLFLQSNQGDETALGICKTPVAAGKGSGGREYGISPGYPERSIIHYRMSSTDPGVMMPELGRVLTHTEGVELIAAWISELTGDCEPDIM